jgi:hypothetical protein
MSRSVRLFAALAATGFLLAAWATARSPAFSAVTPIVRVQGAGGTAATLDHVHWAGDFGVVLRNTSERDALNVDVFARFYSPSGRLVGEDSLPYRISVIPAGTTFYCGDLALTSGPIRRVVATVRVGGTASRHTVLPRLRDVHLERVSGKDRIVVATAVNTTNKTLVSDPTRAYAVFFDGAGRVIGGDFSGGFFGRLRPGHSTEVRFELIVPAATASARASIDPG